MSWNFIFLMGVFTKLRHYRACKISWKNQRFRIQIRAVTLEMALCRTTSQNKKWKKWTSIILWAKKLLLWHPTFRPCAVLAMVLHKEEIQKIQEKWIYNPFWTRICHGHIWSLTWTYLILPKNLQNMYFNSHPKNKSKKKIFLFKRSPNNKQFIFRPWGSLGASMLAPTTLIQQVVFTLHKYFRKKLLNS
jgi:hypothetical protein